MYCKWCEALLCICVERCSKSESVFLGFVSSLTLFQSFFSKFFVIAAVVDVSHVVPLLKEKEKKDKTTPLSMFRSSSSSSSSNASGGGSGST